MRRTSFARWPCSIARTMDLLGDQWTLLVLREAFLGTRRFDRFQSALGIARNTLTERLDRLTGAGMFDRVRYQERPVRYEYVLTDMGRDFCGVLTAMIGWGDRWLADPGDPPLSVVHETCGQATHAVVDCAHCGSELTARSTRLVQRDESPLRRGG